MLIFQIVSLVAVIATYVKVRRFLTLHGFKTISSIDRKTTKPEIKQVSEIIIKRYEFA